MTNSKIKIATPSSEAKDLRQHEEWLNNIVEELKRKIAFRYKEDPLIIWVGIPTDAREGVAERLRAYGWDVEFELLKTIVRKTPPTI